MQKNEDNPDLCRFSTYWKCDMPIWRTYSRGNCRNIYAGEAAWYEESNTQFKQYYLKMDLCRLRSRATLGKLEKKKVKKYGYIRLMQLFILGTN